MKILSNDQYDLMMNTIRRLKKENRELRKKNQALDTRYHAYMKEYTGEELDFPNSHDHKAIMPDDKIY